MRFYHGHASKKTMKNIRKRSNILSHGVGLGPQRFYELENEKWFFDNGAFTKDFNPEKWIPALEKIQSYENQPDFVVLPDSFDNPIKTIKRHWKYVDECRERDLPYYVVAQKPMVAWRPVKEALNLGAEGVFIGGSWGWKQRKTSKIVDLAHKNGLKAHIGMPKQYHWAWKTGADSMDSSNISQNKNYHAIKNFEEKIRCQTTLQQI